MSDAIRQDDTRSRRLVTAAIVAVLALLVIASAWALGNATAPDAADAEAARIEAFEESYAESRAEAAAAAYGDAWQPGLEDGAAVGQREGATAGAAAARRATA